MPHAFRYHRFSTAEQDTGTSLDRQRRATSALCERKDWTVVETIEDKGLSAWKGDHLRVDGLGRFKDRVDAGEIAPGSILVIENLDRLSREKLKKARRWIEDINEAGIAVAVCSPELLLDEDAMSGGNMGTMVLYLMEAKRSTGESDRKSDLLLGAQERRMEKARQGIIYSTRMPAWLSGERDGSFNVIEDRAAIVRQIYEWSADGMGHHAIARLLNEQHEPWNVSRTGQTQWRAGYVRDILTKPHVEGEYHRRTGVDRRPTGEVIAYYPRIVSEELVARARASMRERTGATGPRHSEARNLFSGLVKCGHCGGTMFRQLQRSKGRDYEYLKCVRFNNGAVCANTTLYRYDHFERAALEQILHLALDGSYFARADQTAPLAIKVAQVGKELETLTARQKRLLDFIAEDDDAEEAKAVLRDMRPRIAALRVEQAEVTAELERARGNVSPDEHLRRVIEVRDAIHSDDPAIREPARRKVLAAIRSVVSVVTCRRDYVNGERIPRRQIMMALAGGSLAFQFNNEGELLGRVDYTSVMDQFGGTNTGAEDVVPTIRDRALRAGGGR